MRPASILVLVFLVAAACSRDRHYHARGVVEDVQSETGQIVIAHEDIPGLMPAMTMNFDVADRALLDTLTHGDAIDFEVEFTGKAYVVTKAAVRERGVATTAGGQLGGIAPADDPAPPFQLIDQDGNPRSLEEWRGKVALLDFIWTRCPGPCPILTGLHVDVQRKLPEPLRERVRFVSISLDPVRDTPAVLREYARKRGADLANWSFLTGEPDVVDAVIESYGVGSAKAPDGQIEHVVATFLIDPNGRIARRYIGLEGHDPAELLRDIERLATGPMP
ncbi:MAG: SCO family protein [Myxococcota bacterium]|nr:SCO family protein [Myxococcota bacterium]